MRNNLLMWFTGWGFGTYNNFHRWIARTATLEAVIHSIGYTVLVFLGASGKPSHLAPLSFGSNQAQTVVGLHLPRIGLKCFGGPVN